MTEQSSNRFPLLFALTGAIILLGFGGYLYWRNTGPASTPASAATVAADKAVASAGMSDSQRQATEALVRAYILENPEIISEAIQELQKRDVAKRLAAAGDNIMNPFPGAEFGNPNGDVTLVEFTDYNCGYCRSSVADVQKLVESDGNLRVVIREVPILSQSSREAALWALAAARQGKHRAFHLAMFGGRRPDQASVRSAASQAGLDLAAAEKFTASREAIAEVENNIAIMQQVGFSGTPTFIVGNQILEGAVGYDALKAAVAKARKSA